jgi:single-stranded-DNA-specific exonuclease
VVPDRLVHGYGLTPAIVDLALATPAHPPRPAGDGGQRHRQPAGVAHARALGLQVLVTDHHLPALDADGTVVLPEADVIVNPNQPGCGFESKALAGVGVMFYVLLALRAELRARGAFDAASSRGSTPCSTWWPWAPWPTWSSSTPTTAGWWRRASSASAPGACSRAWRRCSAAAGRAPARRGLRLRLCPGPAHQRRRPAGRHDAGHRVPGHRRRRARRRAGPQLDAINRERREVESGMRDPGRGAAGCAAGPPARRPGHTAAVVLFDPAFHEGVVGIVAGRVKDRLHRPTFVFARGAGRPAEGLGPVDPRLPPARCAGSGQQAPPGVLLRFGGHAMAAGCTLAEADFERFAALQQVAAEWLRPAALQRTRATDGPLGGRMVQHRHRGQVLDAQVWGQGFEAPVFCDEVDVLQQRLVGEKHLKLRVRHAGAAARRHLVRPCRAAARQGAAGLPAQPG